MKQLSKQAVEEFRQIVKKVHGVDISYEEALKQGTDLINFMKIIYKPIPKKKG
jgi:hypothetical protein